MSTIEQEALLEKFIQKLRSQGLVIEEEGGKVLYYTRHYKIEVYKENIDFFINSEKILDSDIFIKKILFKTNIYLKGKKMKLSRKEGEFFVFFTKNIFFIQKKLRLPFLVHPFSTRTQEYREEYLVFLKNLLETYTDDSICIYNYIFYLALSMNFSANNVKLLMEKIKFKNFNIEDKNEALITFNDFVFFYILFDVKKPQIENIDFFKLNIKNWKKLSRKLERIYLTNKKIINYFFKSEFLENEYKYFFNKQIYSNILLLNQKEEGNLKMQEKIEDKRIGIEFKNENAEEYKYVVVLKEDKGENVGEYPHNLIENRGRLVYPVVGIPLIEIPLLEYQEYIKIKEACEEKHAVEKKYPNIRELNRLKLKLEDNKEREFPEIIIRDITEQEILGYRAINREFLKDKGIWIHQGERILEVKLMNYLNYFKGDYEYEINLKFYITQIGNEEKIEEEIDVKPINNLQDTFENNNQEDLIFHLRLDTDSIGNKLEAILTESKYVRVFFRVEIQFLGITNKFMIETPLEIMFKNSKKYVAKNKNVIIDFGTSSTCIAYDKTKLMSLERVVNFRERAYENPTNLMINNWDTLSEKWLDKKFPHILRMEDIGNKCGDFTQGHDLKAAEENLNREQANAVLDKIKLIPYRNLKLKEKITVRPVNNLKKGVNDLLLISGNKEKENIEKLKPIVLYSYLLGRNMMFPIKESTEEHAEEVYVQYKITVPTKFDSEVREAVREDIEEGIKLAAPKDLQDQIKVSMGNEEPVAFAGAMIREGEIEHGDKFAVLDLGGGTLDFSFGMYRAATEEEEEEYDVDNILEIYNTDGDGRGGAEYLISKLSYVVYSENEEEMKKNTIPFIVPHDSKKIEYYPENLLLGRTNSAFLNLKQFNEHISRKVFMKKEGDKDLNLNSISLSLRDTNNIQREITINVDENLLLEKTEEYMRKIVTWFIKLIKENIPEPEKNLKVFRAGNASRNQILQYVLEDMLQNDEILKETKVRFVDSDEAEGIKPKTAVALGEANLDNISVEVLYKNKIDLNSTPFEFYVGRQEKGGKGIFEELISKGSISKDWIEYRRVSKENREVEIFYTYIKGIEDIKDENLKTQILTFEEEEMSEASKLWIRCNKANRIEYKFSKTQPMESEEGEIVELVRY